MSGRRADRLRRWAIVLLICWGGLTGGEGHASVNLPTHHWAYEAIERLTAMGVIDQAMLVAKPYSRKQVARYVASAIQRVRENKTGGDGREAIAEPLLGRLMTELRPELMQLGAMPADTEAKTGLVRYGARLQTEVDAFSVGKLTVRLRENRGGEYYATGEQAQTDLRGWLEIGDAISIVANPKYISNPHALGFGATNNSHNAYMRELNLKVTAANISFEVGRGMQWWGPGYRGTLLMSDHAFPLDMVKLGSEEPFRLPWVFRDLGQWKINTFLTQLERDRDFPRTKVFGLRLSYLPASWLELGLTRLTQFGGRGHDQPFPKIVIDTYGSQPNQGGAAEVNEQAMVDFRARVPQTSWLVPFPAGMQIYGEIGSEDKWSKFPLPSRAGVLGGLYIPQVFRGDSTDLRIEYADTDIARRQSGLSNVWYSHGRYVSGMRYRGFPLGHWMGGDGTDLFVRSTRHLANDLQVGANLDLSERQRSLPVHERKTEVGSDLTWWMSKQVQVTVAYAYQRIQNPGQVSQINPFAETFASGVTSNNHLLWTSFSMQF